MAQGVHGSAIATTVASSDGLLKTGKGWVHWVAISNSHATATSQIELNDSTDDSGTDRWATVLTGMDVGETNISALFDPPIEFTNGIWLDIQAGATISAVVGWT